jgi:Na+/H+-dicarboxylate symporter
MLCTRDNCLFNKKTFYLFNDFFIVFLILKGVLKCNWYSYQSFLDNFGDGPPWISSSSISFCHMTLCGTMIKKDIVSPNRIARVASIGVASINHIGIIDIEVLFWIQILFSPLYRCFKFSLQLFNLGF